MGSFLTEYIPKTKIIKNSANRASTQAKELTESIDRLHEATKVSRTAPRKRIKNATQDISTLTQNTENLFRRYQGLSSPKISSSDHEGDDDLPHPSILLQTFAPSPPIIAINSSSSIGDSDEELDEIMRSMPIPDPDSQNEGSYRIYPPVPKNSNSTNLSTSNTSASPLKRLSTHLETDSRPVKKSRMSYSLATEGQINPKKLAIQTTKSQGFPTLTATATATPHRSFSKSPNLSADARPLFLPTSPQVLEEQTDARPRDQGLANGGHFSTLLNQGGHERGETSAMRSFAWGMEPVRSSLDQGLSTEVGKSADGKTASRAARAAELEAEAEAKAKQEELEFERWLLESVDLVD